MQKSNNTLVQDSAHLYVESVKHSLTFCQKNREVSKRRMSLSIATAIEMNNAEIASAVLNITGLSSTVDIKAVFKSIGCSLKIE